MQREQKLSLYEFEQIQEANKSHGKTLFIDLFVAEKYLPQVYESIPPRLPKAVDQRAFKFEFLKNPRRELIEGIQTEMDGYNITYTLVYEDERLESVRRILENRTGGKSESGLQKVGSHYHVSSLDHSHRDNKGFGRGYLILGPEIKDFDDAINLMNRELLLIRGDMEEGREYNVSFALRPPQDLVSYTFEAYTHGFNTAAVEHNRQDIVDRVDLLRARLP